MRRSEIASLMRRDPRLELYLETADIDGEEHAGLNPIGEIARRLLDAPAVAWPPASELAPADKNRLSPGHHKPSGWKAILDRLARNPYVTSMRFEDGRRATRSRMEVALGSETEITVLIADGAAPPLGLRVATTARNAAERELVLRHLAGTVRL